MKNKILIVGLTAGVGGVETFICNVTKYIDKQKYDVEFLMHEKLNRKYEDELKGYKIHQVVGVKNNPFRFIKEIFSFYKKNQYDIIHLNECDASYFIYVLPVLFYKKTKLIIHSHNGDSNRKFMHNIFKIIQNKRADAKWACSDVAAKWMFGSEKDCLIIHNGIDLNNFGYDMEIKKKIHKELSINSQTVIGSIARFDDQKNHKKIINIFEQYKKINEDSILILVGAGEKEEEIKKIVKEKDLENDVKFLGIRKDIPQLMNAMDLFLLPSLYEGLPFVCVESQASSLPILASNTVSEQTKITDLVEFFELEASNIEWAEKIHEIVNKKLDRNDSKYKKQIRKEGYDIQNSTEIIEKEYELLINSRKK